MNINNDSLFYKKISKSHQKNSIINSNFYEVFEKLEKLKKESFSMDKLNNTIKLCSLSICIDDEKIDVDLKINPIQDFLSDNILLYSKKFHGLNHLNISFLETHRNDITSYQKIDFLKRKIYIELIQVIPELEQKIIEAYYSIYEKILSHIHGSIKSFKIWKDTSIEIWKNLKGITDGLGFDDDSKINNNTIIEKFQFTPEKYGLITHGQLCIYAMENKEFQLLYNQYKEKLGEIERNFYGSALADKIQIFLDTQDQYKKEILESLIRPLQQGKRQLSLDGKFLYLDNGHHLYKNILYNSLYNNYFEKELELIHSSGELLHKYIYGQYIGLGVGSGEKDFELLRYGQSYTSKIFIDSSLSSLQEAELLCRGNTIKMDFGQTHASNVRFSQEWTSNILRENGSINIINSMFGNPHPKSLNKADLKHAHNFFCMLGGTYGNFSQAYKIKFLQEMNSLMQEGDSILLSVFDIPNNIKEKKEIIKYYDTRETFQFVSNFFEKGGISKDNVNVSVEYKDNTICIDALLLPEKTGMTMNFYDKKVKIKTPVSVEILRSERFGETTMQDYVKQSGSNFIIKEEIRQSGNPFIFYVLSKKTVF